jgi:hypothetical protein
MPGDAGGAKGPDFWCAFEDGEVKVIGDEPGKTDYDPGPSEKAIRKAKERHPSLRRRLRPVPFLSVCLAVKPVGEPDAGDRHVGSMSGDGKRSVAEWPKLPRPSSTLPFRPLADVRPMSTVEGNPDIRGQRQRAEIDPNGCVDIAEKDLDLGPRLKIIQGSQDDVAFLARVAADHGPFDIIIDDGSDVSARARQGPAIALSSGGAHRQDRKSDAVCSSL